jgi:hypothetical protein
MPIHFGHCAAGGTPLSAPSRLAGEMAGADDDEHATQRLPRAFFAQARGHERVALGDQAAIQRFGLLREFAECALQHVALLEFLDFLLSDVAAFEQTRDEAGKDAKPVAQAHAAIRALERCADLAIDQPQRFAALFGQISRRLHFGAGLDPELFGETALIRRQGEVRCDHSGLAVADDLEQIQVAPGFAIAHRAEAGVAQFHGDRVELAAFDQRTYRSDARARNVRGAEQRIFDAVARDMRERLVGVRVGRHGRNR